MRVLVCGGREFSALPMKSNGNGPDKEHPSYGSKMQELLFIHSTLYNLCDEFSLWTEEDSFGNKLPTNITIIEGGAKGADTGAAEWAVVNWVELEEYKADWGKHGKSAGFIRNQTMLDKGKPDIVLAFPGGKGTSHMVKIAKEKGIAVREIKYI